jgi:hypothetical protein
MRFAGSTALKVEKGLRARAANKRYHGIKPSPKGKRTRIVLYESCGCLWKVELKETSEKLLRIPNNEESCVIFPLG